MAASDPPDHHSLLLDAHCHLDAHRARLPDALVALRRRHVFTLAVSAVPDGYRRTRAATSGEPLVLVGAGVHPERAAAWADRIDELELLLDEAPFVGTIGLSRGGAGGESDAVQMTVLDRVLAAAGARDLVVNLRVRGAEDEIVTALRRHGVRRTIVDRYHGPVRAFRRLVDLGASFSVGGGGLRDDVERRIAAEIPLDRLLTSTGDPAVHRVSVAEVQRELAGIRSIPVRELQDGVRANFLRLVGDDERLLDPWRRAEASLS